MSSTTNSLRERLHNQIDTLTDQELLMLERFITEIKSDASVVNEPATSYQSAALHDLEDEDDIEFDEEFLSYYRNINPEERAATPIEEAIPLDEVFDRITDRMSAYYGVDMRNLPE